MKRLNDVVYGTFEVDDVISELLMTTSLQRLARIHQSGAAFLAFPSANATRLEHSIGVVRVIQLLGGSVDEQVAGLLHDISHGAFSHVLDYLLDDPEESSHETIKREFFFRDDIVKILKRRNLDLDRIFHEENWPRLEASLPDLCADRIDYTLRDYIVWAQRPRADVDLFLQALTFESGKVVLSDESSAKWFSAFFAELNSDFFRHPNNLAASSYLVHVLRENLRSGKLAMADLYTDDEAILNKIGDGIRSKEFGDGSFIRYLSENFSADVPKIKPRIVDPLVATPKGAMRLSQIAAINAAN